LKHGDSTVGGVMQLPDEAAQAGAPSHWVSYISTPDLDSTVADAQRRDARMYVPPTEIPNTGRFAVLADPQGATIASYEPGDQPSREWDPQVGDVAWNELATTDPKAALDFYRDTFGWELVNEMDMGGGSKYYIFGQDGKQYGGVYAYQPGQQPSPAWTPYVRVTDLDARVDQVRNLGGEVMAGPMEVPGGGRIAIFTDPQGAVCALYETAAA
jgi:predicted enzyme related to lactoylglutathione lyase